jgi:hypothetical protein
MKGTRSWNRREFSVAPTGWFTVLRPSGWFAPWRQRAGSGKLAPQPRATAAPLRQAPDGSAGPKMDAPLRFATVDAREQRLARAVLIALAAAAITLFLLWRIIRA